MYYGTLLQIHPKAHMHPPQTAVAKLPASIVSCRCSLAHKALHYWAEGQGRAFSLQQHWHTTADKQLRQSIHPQPAVAGVP